MSTKILTQLKTEKENLIKDIESKTTLIKNLRIEITQFKDAIELIENPPKYPVMAGALSPLDALKEVQSRAVSEQDKQAKLNDAKAALELSIESLNNLIAEKKDLEFKLNHVESEINWHSFYQPLVSVYQHEFTFYSDKKNKELSMCETDLRRYQETHKKIFSYMSGNPNKYRFSDLGYNGFLSIDKYFEKLDTEIIPELEKRIKKIKNEPLPVLENDAKFRSWLIARVKINEPLQTLITAQNNYIAALNELSNLESECKEVFNFSPFELTTFNRIVGEDFKIKKV